MVVQVIPLIAGLRDENKNLSDVYFAEGLSSEGDSGSGHYYWNETSTLADDGFNVLQVTGVATGRWIRIYAGYNIYSADGSLAGDRTVTLNGHYLAFAGASSTSTFNADGSVTLGSLVGSGTRMVVAGPSGTLGTQAIAPGTGTTTRFIETFTATAGQTTFTTANTLLNDFFDVFVNGVRLDSLSYTNTSNQVVLTDGCAVDDIVDIVGFTSLGVATVLPSQTGNAGKYLRTDGTNTYWDTVSAANNIYTSDGTLTGNRVMTMAGYTLSFNGGNVSIGNTSPLSALHVGDRNVNNSTNPVILISRNVTSAFASNTHAFSDSSLLQLGTGLAYNSYDARVDIGGSNSIDHYAGFQHGINVNTSGTIMNVYGLFTNTTISAGAIENNYSVYAYNPTGAGTITNNFGLYVSNLSKGSNNYGVYLDISSGSGKWNIYSNGTADSYINGNVGIGATPGAYKLDVTGTFRTSGVNTLSNLSGTGTRMVVADASGILSTQSVPSVTGYVPYTGATQDVDLGEWAIRAGQFTLDTSPTGTAVVGTTQWNDTIGSSQTTLKGGSVILKNGVDLVARIVNKVVPSTTLTKAAYQAVRVSGAQGQRLAVAFAQANNDNNSADTIGLVTETIATNQEGFIITVGELEEINTTGSLQGETWVDGDVLYLSPTTAGALTNIKPTGATGHIVVIGYVEYAHAIHGKIYVKIMNGWELDELHNVYISSVANNQGLFYESSSDLWKNKSISTVLGYTPEQPLTFSSPLSRSTNTVSIPAATSSVNGYLSSTDWSTFNSKQNALTNPVTGTGTTNELAYFSGTSAISSLTTATYPSLTELSYVKGVTSSVQTQLNLKQGALTLTTTGTSGAATLVGNTLNIPQYSGGGGGGMAIGGSITSATAGSVLFAGTSGVLAQNNANFFWDNTNARLGIGTTSPSAPVTVFNASSTNVINIHLVATTTQSINAGSFIAMYHNDGTAMQSGNRLAGFVMGGAKDNIGTLSNSIGIFAYAEANWTSTSTPSYISFLTTPSGTTSRSEYLRIFSSGSVLIQNGGTYLDGGFRLDVNGTARIQGNLTTNLTAGSVPFIGTSGVLAQDNSNLFWDNTNKRLGIGTTTPISPIETYSSTIYVAGAFSMYSNTASDEPIFYFRRGRGTLASPVVVSAGDVLGSLRFAAQVTSTVGNFNTNAKIDAIAVTNGAALRFFTNNAGLGISPTQAMQIFGTGNIAIQNGGTYTDAGYRLDVNGTMRVQGNLSASANLLFNTTLPSRHTSSAYPAIFVGNSNSSVTGETTTGYKGINLLANIVRDTSLFWVCQDTTQPGWLIGLNYDTGYTDEFNINRTAATSGTASFVKLFSIKGNGYVSIGLGTTAATALTDIGGSTTSRASLRIRSGTAPTSPNDGDIWFDGTDIKMRIGGVTKTFTLV